MEVRTGGPQQLLVALEGFVSTNMFVIDRTWATYDLGNSVYWGGISSVKLLGGQEVNNYALSSESGIDYRNSMAPIPEPGALAMMLAGLGVLVGLQRRCRH